jgi:hypothetical protein
MQFHVSEEIGVSIFRVRIINVTPRSLPNYSIESQKNLCKKRQSCLISTALNWLPQ